MGDFVKELFGALDRITDILNLGGSLPLPILPRLHALSSEGTIVEDALSSSKEWAGC
jgi:hypothetical protein